MASVGIRAAREGDLPGLTELYNHYVRETPTTFDLDPNEPEEVVPASAKSKDDDSDEEEDTGPDPAEADKRLKSIFRKVGVGGQGELIQKVRDLSSQTDELEGIS